jgi:hypothetical protein
MFSKKWILALIFPGFLAISCSSLDIQQKQNDVYEEKIKTN